MLFGFVDGRISRIKTFSSLVAQDHEHGYDVNNMISPSCD